MAMLFIIQFSVSIAALAFNPAQEKQLLWGGWCGLNDNDKNNIQKQYGCYGGEYQQYFDFRL